MAVKKPKPIPNFNKIIDLTLSATAEGDGFEIACPRTGRKPDIEIEGLLTPDDNVQSFTIRVKNLYTSKILSHFHFVKASCGYEKKMAVSFQGSVINVYTESPGPDRTTVIYCAAASFDDWVSARNDYYFPAGTTLKDILEKLTKDLNFNEATGDEETLNRTIGTKLELTGTAKDVVHRLRSYFTDIKIIVRAGGLSVIGDNQAQRAVFEIPYMLTPPQISGNQYTITAPWDPAIKPGDMIKVNTAFSTKSTETGDQDAGTGGSDGDGKQLEVIEIRFHFGTISGNEMTIVAVLPGEENESN